METCIFDKFSGKFSILSKFLRIFQIYRENLDSKFRNFKKLHL